MGFVPAHWECDHCGRTKPEEDLKPVPTHAVCLVVNVCTACREGLGWTEEIRNARLAELRALLEAATCPSPPVDAPPEPEQP